VIPFIGEIFSQLQAAADTRILAEIRDGEVTGVTGGELLELVRKARTFIASKGLKKGERCGLLAANSIRWVAMDLGGHGGRADRGAAVFAAGAGGVGGDDERLDAGAGVLWRCGVAGRDCAELERSSAAVFV
jgi:hypothetical protein